MSAAIVNARRIAPSPERKRAARAERGARAQARVKNPIVVPLRDPLLSEMASRPRLARAGLVLFAAALLHGAILIVFVGANAIAQRLAPPPPPPDSRIEVRVVEPPPPPPPAPEPEVAPEPEPEQKQPEHKKPTTKKPAPPPDPIDVPKELPPPPPPEQPKPRKIVGLSLESTTEGANGPAFAAGNTRMGETERVAEDPNAVEALPKEAPRPPQEGPNRVATRLPGDTKVVPPKRKRAFQPEYPEDYRAQGIEADVIVELRIGREGQVLSSRILSAPGEYPLFAEAVKAALAREEWNPATRGGEAFEYTVSVPYKFRLND